MAKLDCLGGLSKARGPLVALRMRWLGLTWWKLLFLFLFLITALAFRGLLRVLWIHGNDLPRTFCRKRSFCGATNVIYTVYIRNKQMKLN